MQASVESAYVLFCLQSLQGLEFTADLRSVVTFLIVKNYIYITLLLTKIV